MSDKQSQPNKNVQNSLDPNNLLKDAEYVYYVDIINGAHMGSFICLNLKITGSYTVFFHPLLFNTQTGSFKTEGISEVAYILNPGEIVVKKYNKDILLARMFNKMSL